MHLSLERQRSKTSSVPRLDLNVLPDSYRQARLTATQAALVTLLVVIIALLFPVYQFASASGADTSDLQVEVDSLDLEVQAIHLKQQRLAQLQADIAKYGAVLSQRGTVSDSFQLLVSAGEVILGVHVRNIAISQGQVTLSGVADGYEAAFDYFTALEQRTEDFSSVEWGQIGLSSQAGEVPFSITIELKD
jgi:Tfp pilus assembly protein PilN